MSGIVIGSTSVTLATRAATVGSVSAFCPAYRLTYVLTGELPDLVHHLVDHRAPGDVLGTPAPVPLGTDGSTDRDRALPAHSLGALASGGWIASVPTTPTGKIGQSSFIASRAAPVRPL